MMKQVRLIVLSMIAVLCSSPAFAGYLDELLVNNEMLHIWELVEHGDYEDARAYLGECRGEDMKKDKATLAACNFLLGAIMDKKKEYAKAVEYFRQAYYHAPDAELKERALLERALLYQKQKFMPEAKASFNLFMKNYPNSPFMKEANASLAELLIQDGQLAEAMKYYDKAGSDPKILYKKAVILQKMGKTKEADEAFTKAMDQDKGELLGKTEEYLYYYAEILKAKGQVYQAMDIFGRIKDQPYKDKATLSLGSIQVDKSNPDRAIEYLNPATRSTQKPVQVQALLKLAGALLEKGRVDEAKHAVQQVQTLSPTGRDRQDMEILIARLYAKEEKWKEALEAAKKLLKDPSLAKEAFHLLETSVFEALKAQDKSGFVQMWESAGPMLLDKADEKYFLSLLDLTKETGKPYFDILLWMAKKGSESARFTAISRLAGIYADLGEKAKALEYYEVVKKKEGVSDTLLRQEARIYFESGDGATAAEKLLELKKLTKEDLPLLRSTLGSAKDTQKALTAYEKAVAEFGGDATDYNMLAGMYDKSGNTVEALKYYEEAFKKDPNNEWAAYKIAFLVNNEEEASKLLQKLSGGASTLGNFSKAIVKQAIIDKKLAEDF